MSYFTDVFHALDFDNKGYILINDFKSKVHDFLHQHDYSDLNNQEEQEKAFTKFLNIISQSDDQRIYFFDFVNAVNQLHPEGIANDDSSLENNERENKNGDVGLHNESSPFINDGESYSTGDNSFDEYINHDIGKQNRKRIKALQQIDLGQFEPVNVGDQNFYIYQNQLSNFSQANLPKSHHRQRRRSDFVTCDRLSNNSHYKGDEDESKSFNNCWTSYSGSVTDLYCRESMTDIKKQLEKLEQSMDNLQTISTDSKQFKRKLLEENQNLKAKIHNLEDTITSQKKQFEKNLNSEMEASRKSLNKLEQSAYEDMDILKERLKFKDMEVENLKKELNAALEKCENMNYDKLRTEDKLGDLQQQMSFIEEDMKRLKDIHSRELELLNKEQKASQSEKCRQSDNKEQSLNNTEQLHEEISKLRVENQNLKSKLEYCEEEFLAFSIQQGENVLRSISIDNSWMSEIDGYSKQELIDLLVKEKDANFRLREYVTNILTRIIERDPSLLEIY